MQKNILKFIIINICITLSINAFAQGDVPNIDFSKRTETRDGGGSAPKKEKFVDDVNYKNAISIDLLGAAGGGYLALNYERVIRKNLSIEVGAGMTYVGFMNRAANGFSRSFPRTDDAIDYWKAKGMRIIAAAPFPFYHYNGGNQDIGFYVMVEPRFYPQDIPLEGFFLGLRLQNQVNPIYFYEPKNLGFTTLSPNIASRFPVEDATEVSFDAIAQAGWEWHRNQFFISLEGGFGARSLTCYGAYSIAETTNGQQSMRLGGTQSSIFPMFNLVLRTGAEF